MKLTHKSGLWYFQSGTTGPHKGIWGQAHNQFYKLWVTDPQQKILYPTKSTGDVGAIVGTWYYTMAANNVNSPTLTLKHPTRDVNPGDELRFYDGSYLHYQTASGTANGHGEICFTVEPIWKRLYSVCVFAIFFSFGRRQQPRI